MSDLIGKKTTKREFLKILGLTSASLIVSGAQADELMAEAMSKSSDPGGEISAVLMAKSGILIYHTSTRRQKSCNACKSHAINRIYSSRQAADLDRAHSGCNCHIVEEKIARQDYVKAFWPDGPGNGIVYDRRWAWPPPLPAELDLE